MGLVFKSVYFVIGLDILAIRQNIGMAIFAELAHALATLGHGRGKISYQCSVLFTLSNLIYSFIQMIHRDFSHIAATCEVFCLQLHNKMLR